MSDRVGLPRQELSLETAAEPVEQRLGAWQAQRFGARLWERDPTLWSSEPLAELGDRLGWLELPAAMEADGVGLAEFGQEAAEEGFRFAVLLGMGGSSLAPELFQRTFGSRAGRPELLVLDSTHPAAVRAVERRIDGERTLFVVSSKSGTTVETLSFFRYFWSLARRGREPAGHSFVAITDPGTPLAVLARERQFRRLFSAPAEVGGRYSALTVFGLVPAALIGVDLPELLARARAMAEACGPEARAAESPGLVLGAVLGEAARAGRDKLILRTTPGLGAFPDWLEQLVAESTGKAGRGIIPVPEKTPPAAGSTGRDRVLVALSLAGDPGAWETGEGPERQRESGSPAVHLRLRDRLDLGAELFRWEVAVAAAGAVLGINPFDQPDVQLAKDLARQAMQGQDDSSTDVAEVSIADTAEVARRVDAWLSSVGAGDYLGIQAYLAPTPEIEARLRAVQRRLAETSSLPVTAGYGPRFLHSTGQLHKGGPASGAFLQLVDDPEEELPIPETDYGFAALLRAQALGDAAALVRRGRRLLRVVLPTEAAEGLAAVERLLEGGR